MKRLKKIQRRIARKRAEQYKLWQHLRGIELDLISLQDEQFRVWKKEQGK